MSEDILSTPTLQLITAKTAHKFCMDLLRFQWNSDRVSLTDSKETTCIYIRTVICCYIEQSNVCVLIFVLLNCDYCLWLMNEIETISNLCETFFTQIVLLSSETVQCTAALLGQDTLEREIFNLK